MHHGDGRKYISITSGLAPFFYPYSLQNTKPGYETRSVLGPTTFVPPKTPKHRTHHISWQLPFYFEGSPVLMFVIANQVRYILVSLK
jgi:hypothetical protein